MERSCQTSRLVELLPTEIEAEAVAVESGMQYRLRPFLRAASVESTRPRTARPEVRHCVAKKHEGREKRSDLEAGLENLLLR